MTPFEINPEINPTFDQLEVPFLNYHMPLPFYSRVTHYSHHANHLYNEPIILKLC